MSSNTSGEPASKAQSTAKGACLCRGVTFSVVGEPEACIQCYCTHCQKNAGGPCQISAKFNKNQVELTSGDDLLRSYVLKDTMSTFDKHKVFCAACGCTLWTIPTRHGGEHMIIRTSIIDNGLLKYPAQMLFFRQRVPQPLTVPETKQFDTMPGF